MITTPQDYYSKLHLIQDTNKPTIAVLLPSDEKTFNVNLSTRTIDAPEYLSVAKDHLAETIYFVMDRYYDGVDLSQTTGIVQYINADKEPRIYAIPFYDITTFKDKILFPWCIEGEVTKKAGVVQYSLKFYHTYKDEENNILFDLNLNTTMAKSKILNGLDVVKQDENYNYIASEIENALARIDLLSKMDIEWIDV